MVKAPADIASPFAEVLGCSKAAPHLLEFLLPFGRSGEPRVRCRTSGSALQPTATWIGLGCWCSTQPRERGKLD